MIVDAALSGGRGARVALGSRGRRRGRKSWWSESSRCDGAGIMKPQQRETTYAPRLFEIISERVLSVWRGARGGSPMMTGKERKAVRSKIAKRSLCQSWCKLCERCCVQKWMRPV